MVGAVVWLTSEILFFGTLFATWFSLRASASGSWPPEGAEVGRALPTIGTVLLVSSSVTVQLATRSLTDGQPAKARALLLGTLGLGAVFLTLQRLEWSEVDFAVDDHAFGTAFFALTGFHGLHVLAGLIALAVMVRRVARLGSASHKAVEVMSLYWHFVDVVWLALYASVYLAG